MQLCRQGFKLIMVENNADNVLLNIALGFLDIYYLATNYVAVSALFCLFRQFCMYNSMLSSTKLVVVKIILFRSEPHNCW